MAVFDRIDWVSVGVGAAVGGALVYALTRKEERSWKDSIYCHAANLLSGINGRKAKENRIRIELLCVTGKPDKPEGPDKLDGPDLGMEKIESIGVVLSGSPVEGFKRTIELMHDGKAYTHQDKFAWSDLPEEVREKMIRSGWRGGDQAVCLYASPALVAARDRAMSGAPANTAK